MLENNQKSSYQIVFQTRLNGKNHPKSYNRNVLNRKENGRYISPDFTLYGNLHPTRIVSIRLSDTSHKSSLKKLSAIIPADEPSQILSGLNTFFEFHQHLKPLRIPTRIIRSCRNPKTIFKYDHYSTHPETKPNFPHISAFPNQKELSLSHDTKKDIHHYVLEISTHSPCTYKSQLSINY